MASLNVVTWNIAAVNNNPFEYWLTHPDADYAKLMQDIEKFVDNPGDLDVPIAQVFTKPMFEKLDGLMTAQGWPAAEECAAAYATLAEQKIISGFLKNKDIGNKRLISMPDRVTNTIDVVGGGCAYRPTVISCFEGDMATVDKWWPLWTEFLFGAPVQIPDKKGGEAKSKLPCALLGPIPRAKYPALTEAEEAITDGKWVALKAQILSALMHQKDQKTLDVLTGPYGGSDVFFLQEVRTSTARGTLPAALTPLGYCIFMPKKPNKADQNSVIAVKSSAFDAPAAVDVTADVMALFPSGGAVATDGDLLVLSIKTASGTPCLLASFHGDTDGLASAPTLEAVHAYAQTVPGTRLLFGLDANTHAPKNVVKKGKQADASEFVTDFTAKGYVSAGGERWSSEITICCARTFLQPQLQKAIKACDKLTKGDVNPKDFVLFPQGVLTSSAYGRDNTGKRAFTEDMVLPTLDWPSDHALVYATLEWTDAAVDVTAQVRGSMFLGVAGVALAAAIAIGYFRKA